MNNLLNTLFPPKCLFCRKEVGTVFCSKCLEKVQAAEQPRYHLKIPNTSDRLEVVSPFEYDGVVRECIKESKYAGKQFAALDILASLAISYTFNLGYTFENFVLVPIPLNKRKYRDRGFNQVEIITKVFCNKYKLRTDCSILIRAKETDAQHQQNREQRFKNMTNAFSVNKDTITEKNILLVDDICTTGATLTEAYKTLRQAGFTNIKAWTLSKRS